MLELNTRVPPLTDTVLITLYLLIEFPNSQLFRSAKNKFLFFFYRDRRYTIDRVRNTQHSVIIMVLLLIITYTVPMVRRKKKR